MSTMNEAHCQKGSAEKGLAAQRATRAIFFISGFAMAAWAPLVPFVKMRLAVDDGMLGFLLLSLGFGSLLAMPLTGLFTGRWGCRAVILLSSALLGLSLLLLTQVDAFWQAVPALLLFGASMGMIDVAMNIQAVVVEKASDRAVMSGFHGFFSVGAGGVTLLLSLGLTPLFAILGVIMLMLCVLFGAQHHLLRVATRQENSPYFVLPRGAVMFIGLLCFIMFLAEGAILDWSALFLSGERGLNSAQAGMGYAAFSVAMALGRLTGDTVVRRFGRYALLTGGSLCASLGLLLAISIDHAGVAILGFTLVGLGASNVVPILFSAAGNQRTMPPHLAIAAITTVGYAGILLGPTLLGFIAKWSHLSAAFGVVAGLLLIVCVSARAITR